MGVPQNGWFIMGTSQSKMGDEQGYPYLGNFHMLCKSHSGTCNDQSIDFFWSTGQLKHVLTKRAAKTSLVWNPVGLWIISL